MDHLTPRGNRLIPRTWKQLVEEDPIEFSSLYCVPYPPKVRPDGVVIHDGEMFEDTSGNLIRRREVIERVARSVRRRFQGGEMTYMFPSLAEGAQVDEKVFLRILDVYCAATGCFKIHSKVSEGSERGIPFRKISFEVFDFMLEKGWMMGESKRTNSNGIQIEAFTDRIVLKDKRVGHNR